MPGILIVGVAMLSAAFTVWIWELGVSHGNPVLGFWTGVLFAVAAALISGYTITEAAQ